MSELTSLFRFNTNWFGPRRQPSQFISAPLLAWRCVLTHASLSHVNTGNWRPPGEQTPFKATKRGIEWKDPGRWHSRSASIKENNKQRRSWRQLSPKFVFILRQICMFEVNAPAKDVSIRKTWMENNNFPHIEMYLSWSHNTMPSLPSLFISLCPSPSLTHSGSTVQLCTESLQYAVQGPRWGPSLGSRTKQRRWCYQSAARRLSARIGPGWPSGRLADACPCRAPSASPPWTSAACGKAVQFVCGCILILHLFGCSHAWPSKPAALLDLLVLIALAWLAVCFWLHSLISIPQEAATTTTVAL